MSDDIVNRVLALNHPDAADAADEIENLRHKIATLKELLQQTLKEAHNA